MTARHAVVSAPEHRHEAATISCNRPRRTSLRPMKSGGSEMMHPAIHIIAPSPFRPRPDQSDFRVGTPVTILPPCAVLSPTRMTPRPLIFAKLEPFTIGSGSGGDAGQPHCPPSTASGMPMNLTRVYPEFITGPPPWIGQVCGWPTSAIV